MWKPWRKFSEPWRDLPGWEFDLLRALPPDVAKSLFQQVFGEAHRRLMRTGYGLAFAVACGAPAVVSTTIVWAIAAALGLGPLGRMAVEVAFHATIGVVIFHPLVRLHWRYLMPHLRAALAEELRNFARDEAGLTDPSWLDSATLGDAVEGR
jgi:hypothetical protein